MHTTVDGCIHTANPQPAKVFILKRHGASLKSYTDTISGPPRVLNSHIPALKHNKLILMRKTISHSVN